MSGLNTPSIRFKDATILTVASGVVTATQGYHIIAAESSTSDDLDTITASFTDSTVNSVDYRPVLVIKADTGDTITVKHDTGNINLSGASDYDLSGDAILMLFYDGSTWSNVDGSAGGSIGGSTGATDNAILRADGTGGSTLQNSGVIIDDSDNVSGIGTLSTTGDITTTGAQAVGSAGLSLKNISGTTLLNVGAGSGVNATISAPLSMDTTNKIINLADPTNAQDAATKAYVDGLLPVDLTADVTGILPVANGGTNASTASGARTSLDAQQTLSGLTLTGATVATDDKVLIQDTNDSDNLKTVTAQSIADLASGGGGVSVAILRDVKAQGTDGGSFTSGAWRVRDLNDEYDPDGIVTLSTNEFTLDAGTYRLQAMVPAHAVGSHKAQLYDVTNTAVVTLGSNGRNDQASPESTSTSFIECEFTIVATTTYRIEHRCSTTLSVRGFGMRCSFAGVDEVYTIVKIEKVA